MNKPSLVHHLRSKSAATIATSITLLFSSGAMTAFAQLQALPTRHTRDAVTQHRAAFVQHLDPNQTLHLVIGLPIRDQAGLDAFLGSLYNPGSPNYHQYLSVAQFTEMFGPTQTDYDAAIQFAQRNGFVVTHTASNRMIFQVDASVANIEKAFNIKMNLYQHPTENRTFYAPDREPTVNLATRLWNIDGLDNFAIPRPASLKQDMAAQPMGTGSGPGGYFLGSDLRAAYYGSGPLTGAGQRIAILEYVGYNPDDITKYFDTYGPPLTTTVTPVSTDGTPAVCTTCDDAEQALDIEFSISMAPGLDECIVYVGSSDRAILNAFIDDNTAKIMSCSWSWMPADHNIDEPLFQEMAAQGQTYAAAAGDSSSWGAGEFNWPQESANVLCVGGTHLVTSGPGGTWVSETGWTFSGGGIAIDRVKIPFYQQNRRVVNHDNNASKSTRNGPDVSMEGDFQNYICYNNTCTGGWGGTSFSAPEYVGYLALANEQATAHGQSSVGFVNEALYRIAIKGDYGSNYHDVTIGTNFGFNCVMGFDLVTGWGTPNGDTLINSLAP